MITRFYFRFCHNMALMLWGVCLVVVSSGALLAQTTSLTINADQRRSIGGVSTLDRAQFFTFTETLVPPANSNLGNLRQKIYLESELNLTSGRVSTELDQGIAFGLAEDPSRSGFVDPNALRLKLQGSYRNFVTTGSRWEPLRNSTTNPILVNSGRSATFFPAYMRTGEQDSLFPNRDSYAEFLNTYLDEVVYGDNAFMPIDANRFHLEIINEPDLHIDGAFSGSNATLLASSQELAEYHRDITQAIKAEHPLASVGGPSLALTGFSDNDYRRWDNTVKPFIDIAGADVDFYSIHPYERYDVQPNGSVNRQVDQSPGRINSQLDMIVNQQEQTHGNRLPISLTEYASFNRSNNGSYAGYPRDEQQWDLSRDFREQLLVYINRPDVILNAVPFVQGRHFSNDLPTPESADNVLFEQDASGAYSETFVANTFRIYAPVKGDYINVDGSSGDLQTAAFRDGDTVYLMLNNLLDTDQNLDLDLMLDGMGSIDSAFISRVYRDESLATPNVFVQDQDITGTFGSLMLNPKEGAVITFTVSGDSGLTTDLVEETYFGDQIAVGLDDGQIGQSPDILIDAETSGAVSASLRVGYSRASGPEFFGLTINDNFIFVPGGTLGIDDEYEGSIDDGLISREIDIPLEHLVDGENIVRLSFSGDGFLSSAALKILSTVGEPGDFDQDGDVDADDIDFYSGQLEQVATGELEQLDLDDDGQVTLADHDLHVTTLVQTSNGGVGTAVGDINLDGVVDVLGDAFILVGNLGSTENVGYSIGDLNADGVINVLGDAFRLVGNLGADNDSSSNAVSSSVPEPGGVPLIMVMAIVARLRRARPPFESSI